MKEWKTYKVGDICSSISETYKSKSKSVVLINTSDVLEGRCLNHEFVPNKDLKGQFKKAFKFGDILYSEIRPANKRFAYIDFDATDYIASTKLMVLRNNDKVTNRFLYHYLKSESTIAELQALAESRSGTFPQITFSELSQLEISIPDIETQMAISSFIDTLESKIELNRQINDNLEQQASSLLSDWISTYPCRTYKLSDICKYANAKCETGNLTPQNYISTENMLPNKKGIVEASNIPTGKATCYKVDDILIANIRPYFQKIWKADINGGCSADVLCIRANIESHSPILYWLLHQDAFFEYVMTGAKGCKMPRGDKQHIMNWSIDLPEVQYWADLATQLGSIDQQIAYNRIESINLSNLRDTLLPKLMSGEIKINEIDC